MTHITHYAKAHETSADATFKQTGLMPWLHKQWDALIHALTRGHEPRIWQKRTAKGDIFYRAYDPHTGRSAHLASEHDLRSWLEQLPYQQRIR